MAVPYRYRWKDAVRKSGLPGYCRLIAFIYFEYCHRDDPDCRSVWVNFDTLCDETGMAKNSITKYKKVLVERGWFVPTGEHKGPRSARFALEIPASSVATSRTVGGDEMTDLESQGVGHQAGPQEERKSRKTRAVESQNEGSRVLDVATESLESQNPGETPGFAATSPAPEEPQNPDVWMYDDPWDRNQEIEPPGHARMAFAAVRKITEPAPEPDFTLCEHGVILGLPLGDGEYACCPPTTEDTR